MYNCSEYKQKVEELMQQTGNTIEVARSGVKMLQKSKKGDVQTREGLYKTSLKNLQTAVRNFWQAQNEVRSANRDQMIRQYKIARPNATDDEINQALESGQGDIFSQEILSSRVQDQQRILGAVQDRQKALEKIAKSMEELLVLSQELESLINVIFDIFINVIRFHHLLLFNSCFSSLALSLPL
jgi:syntaxin 1B/2/3